MGTQWQYKPTNEEYKSGTRLIEILIETRAKGGAMLLNVGPKPDGRLPEEQEARIREVALWHAVNGEAVHETRPWIVTNENHLWFTQGQEDRSVYVFITGIPDWKRGERREFTIRSVRSTKDTTVSVLGQSSEWVEYQPSVDASCRFAQSEQGLTVSVVRAQRLYNNSKWPNPVVVKLSGVEAGIIPPRIETVASEEVGDQIRLEGNLVDLAGHDSGIVFFQYRQRGGFVEELYMTEWQQTPEIAVDGPGPFSAELAALPPGDYQFRSCVHVNGLAIHGDHLRFQIS
jgi:alpha-L-fucosidase